jgi:hypothetical protein
MTGLDAVRAVADAVLYEGYLLYPYRATSAKNQLRWQFGVLGPYGAADAGIGEDFRLEMQTLLRNPVPLTVHLRFLQLQRRRTERVEGEGFVDAPELRIDGERWFAWDEAIEVERRHLLERDEDTWTVVAEAAEEVEELRTAMGGVVAGRLVRQRWLVEAACSARLEPIGGLYRLTVAINNLTSSAGLDKESALRQSLIGTHLIIEGAGFVSVIDPPAEARAAAESCRQHRCWPVLVGEPGEELRYLSGGDDPPEPPRTSSFVLGSPIILYDYPEIAQQSAGSLFDATEIDEILTLRVLTMTEEEKAEARATDRKAAAIIERCDQMTPEELQRLHGVLRDPFGAGPDLFPGPDLFSGSDPFTAGLADDPYAIFDDDHDPETASVLIFGERVGKGSMVRINPQRRADAQDLFYADQLARVVAVHRDLDGEIHLAVVLVDDPAAELHDWYGRYLYFAPDELEPVGETLEEQPNASSPTREARKENQK